MLVIARNIGEHIVLSHPALEKDILVTLSKIRTLHQAVIGIQAPASVTIRREEIAGKPQQGESAPEIFLFADRERAKQAAGPMARMYIQRLEKIAGLANQLWDAFAVKSQSPEEHRMLAQLLAELVGVNFLSTDEAYRQVEQAYRELAEAEQGELPREVIFG